MLRPIAMPRLARWTVPAGSTSGIEGVAIGGLIISGFALLAFWEIAVSRWTSRTER